VGEGGEIEADGVGIEEVGRAAFGEEVALDFLHTIFCIAPGAVEVIVEGVSWVGRRIERGDDEATVLLAGILLRLAGQRLGLGDQPALCRPGVEHPCR